MMGLFSIAVSVRRRCAFGKVKLLAHAEQMVELRLEVHVAEAQLARLGS